MPQRRRQRGGKQESGILRDLTRFRGECKEHQVASHDLGEHIAEGEEAGDVDGATGRPYEEEPGLTR